MKSFRDADIGEYVGTARNEYGPKPRCSKTRHPRRKPSQSTTLEGSPASVGPPSISSSARVPCRLGSLVAALWSCEPIWRLASMACQRLLRAGRPSGTASRRARATPAHRAAKRRRSGFLGHSSDGRQLGHEVGICVSSAGGDTGSLTYAGGRRASTPLSGLPTRSSGRQRSSP